MSALVCDVCGGNLAMDASGDFAVCESCGMKHSKERVKIKVQEVKGVVETTKGTAEKERLLNNAHAFVKLGKLSLAEKIYEQLVEDYPNDWTLYIEYAKIIMQYFPISCSHNDIINLKEMPELFYKVPVNNIGSYSSLGLDSIYEKYEHLVFSAMNLAHDKTEKYFDALWNAHDEQHQKYIHNLYENVEKGLSFFNEIDFFLTHDDYVPENLCLIFSKLSRNAEEINSLFKESTNKYDNIWKLGTTNFNFYSDGTKKVDHIRYLSSKEAVLCGNFFQGEYGTFSNCIILTFNHSYTPEQLIGKLKENTKEEQSIVWAQANMCEKCGSRLDKNSICPQCGHINENKKELICSRLLFLCKKHPDQLNLISELYSNFDGNGKLHDKSWDEFNSPRHHLVHYLEKIYVSNIEIIGDTLYIYYERFSHGNSYRYSLSVSCGDIPKIIDYLTSRHPSNVCQFCGGQFKGLFSKVCIKCGKPKDY